LTSGNRNKAQDGIEMLSRLVKQAGKRIIVMPGSGINDLNIASIAINTDAKEFHLTGRKEIDSDMIFRRQNISMGGSPDTSEFSRKVTDTEMIKRIISILQAIPST
jgi:copper homeostasis protein